MSSPAPRAAFAPVGSSGCAASAGSPAPRDSSARSRAARLGIARPRARARLEVGGAIGGEDALDERPVGEARALVDQPGAQADRLGRAEQHAGPLDVARPPRRTQPAPRARTPTPSSLPSWSDSSRCRANRSGRGSPRASRAHPAFAIAMLSTKHVPERLASSQRPLADLDRPVDVAAAAGRALPSATRKSASNVGCSSAGTSSSARAAGPRRARGRAATLRGAGDAQRREGAASPRRSPTAWNRAMLHSKGPGRPRAGLRQRDPRGEAQRDRPGVVAQRHAGVEDVLHPRLRLGELAADPPVQEEAPYGSGDRVDLADRDEVPVRGAEVVALGFEPCERAGCVRPLEQRRDLGGEPQVVLAVRAADRRGIRLALESCGRDLAHRHEHREQRHAAVVVLAQEAAVDELEERAEQVGRPRRASPSTASTASRLKSPANTPSRTSRARAPRR